MEIVWLLIGVNVVFLGLYIKDLKERADIVRDLNKVADKVKLDKELLERDVSILKDKMSSISIRIDSRK